MEYDINERIREFAKAKAMTASMLATSVGTSISAAYVIFRGGAKPSLDMVTKMAETFPELSMDWLITGHGEMLRSPGAVDASCWDLLKREEEQHERLKQDYTALKGMLRQSRVGNVLLDSVEGGDYTSATPA
jgi:transcriptional regulator with XRE-family HTH domain